MYSSRYCTGCTPAKAPLFAASTEPRATKSIAASGWGLNFTTTTEGLRPYTGRQWFGYREIKADHKTRAVQRLFKGLADTARAGAPTARINGGAGNVEIRKLGQPFRPVFDLGMTVSNNYHRAGFTNAPSGRSREQLERRGMPGRPKKFSGSVTLSDSKRTHLCWMSPSCKLTSIMLRYVKVRDLWNAGETLVAIGERVNVSKDRVVRMVNWLHRQSDAQKSAKTAT
jgi:hypothetical protein